MGKIIEVQLGEYRPVGFYDQNDIECNRGDYVIIEQDRSMEFGHVLTDTTTACAGKTDAAAGKIIRVLTEGDKNQLQNNRLKAQDAVNACIRKISERKLDMQIVKAEYTFDCSKVIFFFTAEGRVDFRSLVKDLAKIFRVRIELKQIGVRDRAKIIAGYGVCGRELCCSSYLKGFHQLSIKMAKEQGLPLNPTRISGVCGRIKCCMAYEYLAYRDLARNLPSIGDKITTPEGKGSVRDVNILKKLVFVDLGEGKMTKVSFAPAKASSGADDEK
ncbi:MAG: stage 0 sporulation family protein [Candidatus Omnitrophica bacterium]|nr:stage 0 sporulation family protein [Candidatus Omnitrophota bacterium]